MKKLLLLPAVAFALSAAQALAGQCGACATQAAAAPCGTPCAAPAPAQACGPQYITQERTVMCPEMRTETRKINVTEMREEERTRTWTVNNTVWEDKSEEYQVMVPSTEQRTAKRTVCKPVMQTCYRDDSTMRIVALTPA